MFRSERNRKLKTKQNPAKKLRVASQSDLAKEAGAGSVLSSALRKTQTAQKQVLEPAASQGTAGPGGATARPPLRPVVPGARGRAEGARLARTGARPGWDWERGNPAPSLAAVSQPGPHGCWTAPTPARQCPRRPPSRNSPGRAAGGPSRARERTLWGRAQRYLWRQQLSGGDGGSGGGDGGGDGDGGGARRARSRPARSGRGARPLSPGRQAPAQLSAPSPLTSYLSPPAPAPTVLRMCSQWRAHA